ncbi:unnamed protein product [Menidia menidia]|uniref:(Atlantic silverside) hypothetical protein n=1 Tax=Menidia menidia TaxID=238744 RepID=A0A8S4B2V4_9TELE|nr:unnamed protein product [Menidia menidia]
MSGSSLQKVFFWKKKKKKKSPVNKAFSQLKRALPKKKSKRKSILQRLNPSKTKKDKHSQKRFSLTTDKKSSTPLKRLSLGNIRKDSVQDGSVGRKENDKGGLDRFREQIRKKFTPENKKELDGQPGAAPPPVDLKEVNVDKTSKKKLKDILRSTRQIGSKTNRQS